MSGSLELIRILDVCNVILKSLNFQKRLTASVMGSPMPDPKEAMLVPRKFFVCCGPEVLAMLKQLWEKRRLTYWQRLNY